MKNIFKLFNNVAGESEELPDVTWSKEEQDRVFQMIISKEKEKNNLNKKIKLVLGSAAVAVVSILALNPTIQTIASNVYTYFTENTKTNYKKEFKEDEKVVKEDNGAVELMSVTRQDNVIDMKVKLTFNEDVSELKNLCEDVKLTEDSMYYDLYKVAYNNGVREINFNTIQGYVLEAPPFINSKLFINNKEINSDEEKEVWKELQNEYLETKDDNIWAKAHKAGMVSSTEDDPITFLSVNNVEVSGNTLIQNFKFTLNDFNYDKDILISMKYKDIVLENHTIEGEWNLDYTISSSDYETKDLNKLPINFEYKSLIEATYRLESYAVTPSGIKIFSYEDWDSIQRLHVRDNIYAYSNVRMKAYDDLGNNYLLYPIFEDYENNPYLGTYTIYDGLDIEIEKEAGNEYKTELDPNAKTLTISFEENYVEEDEDTHEILENKGVNSEEITIQIQK